MVCGIPSLALFEVALFALECGRDHFILVLVLVLVLLQGVTPSQLTASTALSGRLRIAEIHLRSEQEQEQQQEQERVGLRACSARKAQSQNSRSGLLRLSTDSLLQGLDDGLR